MKYRNNIISAFLGFILGMVVNYTPKYNKPPNLQHHKRRKVSIAHNKVEADNHIITHVTLTCYQPLTSQCDNEPFTTSDGSKINLKHLKRGEIKWCAISRDLLYLFPKDKPKKIWTEGYGIYEVRDVMNKRYKHSIDLLIHPKDSMRIRKKNVKVKIYRF